MSDVRLSGMILHQPHTLSIITVLAAMVVLGGLPAWAQTVAPAEPQATPDRIKPDAKPENPGLLNELGKLFVKPADLFPGLKLSPDADAPIVAPSQPSEIPVATPPAPAIATPAPSARPSPPTTAAAPAKPTAASLVPQMIRGRAACPLSSNGAPDCKAGADRLCQDKGFAGGSGLDMDSAQTCSTKALLAGARTIKDICKTETFVTRAMCQ